jgi:hypothetical protein
MEPMVAKLLAALRRRQRQVAKYCSERIVECAADDIPETLRTHLYKVSHVLLSMALNLRHCHQIDNSSLKDQARHRLSST